MDLNLSQMTYKLVEASRPTIYKEKEKLQKAKNQLQLLTQGILSSKLSAVNEYETKLAHLIRPMDRARLDAT